MECFNILYWIHYNYNDQRIIYKYFIDTLLTGINLTLRVKDPNLICYPAVFIHMLSFITHDV
jgi:hypothetical protein